MESLPRRGLNEHQQRRLIVTCQHVDWLLKAVEQSFADAQSDPPFRRYTDDLVPGDQRLVNDSIARIRAQLIRVLDEQGLSAEPHRTSLRHSTVTHLRFVDVAIEELRPHYMRGYSEVMPDAAVALTAIVEPLQACVRQLIRALRVDR